MARRRGEDRNVNNTTESQLAALIDSVTASPANALDVALIASIKQIVRLSDANVRLAFRSLMDKIKHKHSQVRYLALLVVDELFTRSKLFRTLLVDDFETFMLFSVGYRSDCPLPPPVNRATALRAKSMEILEKWNDSFGSYYKPLRLGYEYLKNTLHLQFPNLRQAAAQAEQQRKEREARSRALVLEKYETLKESFPALCADIQNTLKQLDECFEILYSAIKQEGSSGQMREEDDNGGEVDVNNDDFEEYGVNSLRQILAQAACQPPVPCETHYNKPVFDTVRDLCRLIVSQHVPVVQGWMSVLIRVDTQDKESHGSLFRRVMDIRNELSSAKAKCVELGVEVHQHSKADEDTNADDDEIIWEDGGFVDGEACEQQEVQVSEQMSVKAEESIPKGENKPVTPQKAVKSDVISQDNGSTREKLLEEAPLLPWGSYLDRWGTEHAVPVNQRGLLLESHWGKVDFDALLPASKVTEMNMQASYYTSIKSEIPPCLAPLKNGGLCQRQDLRVCPLHGPIKPRDSSGNPIPLVSDDQSPKSQSSSKDSRICAIDSTMTSDEKEFVKAVAAKAVANVRAQDAIELRKKIDRRLQAKRNREHNVAVLRDAALAHTSLGLGETLGEDLEGYGDHNTGGLRQQSKRAKASLKAMLQPKPTAKDRLAERLLSSRANDATIRVITRDEDVAYREAFSNQW